MDIMSMYIAINNMQVHFVKKKKKIPSNSMF